MPRLLLAFVLAASTLSANAAESFVVGRPDIAAAPGGRNRLRGASNGTGHLAVWADTRASSGEVYATRLIADGRPIDAEGLLLGRISWFTDLFVASAQGDYLVVWKSGALFTAARVRADGRVSVQTIDPLPGHGTAPVALVSNGSSYLLHLRLVESDSSSSYAVLLDLDGRPSSGALQLARRGWASVAGTRHRSWFVTVSEWSQFTATVRGGIVSEEMFPKIGRVDELRPLRLLFDRSEIVYTGSDAAGVYILRTSSRWPKLIYQRFNDLTGEVEGWPVEFASPSQIPDLRVVTTGQALYLAYSFRSHVTCQRQSVRLLRVGRDGTVREIAAPGGRAAPHNAGALFDGPGGPVMLWEDHRVPPSIPCEDTRRQQMYAATLNGDSWTSGGRLLSGSRRAQYAPRIAKGSMGHLAVWIELDTDESLVARLLDGDGRPVTEPVVLTDDTAIQEVVVAFDGRRFLAVWQDVDRGILGRFLTPDAQPSGEPFVILPEGLVPRWSIATLLWDGSVYLLTAGDGIVRVTDAGEVLDEEPQELSGWERYRTYLAPCVGCNDSRFTALGVELTASVVSAGPAYYSAYRQLTIEERDGQFRVMDEKQWLKGGSGWGYVAPAFAKSGDGLFGITYDAMDGGLRSLNGEVIPYGEVFTGSRLQAERIGDRIIVAAGRDLARHAADGSLIGYDAITPDAGDSMFAVDGSDALVVLYQERRWGPGGALSTIKATRVGVGSGE